MEIKLTKNKVAIVDEDDYETLSKYKWTYSGHGYAFRTNKKNKCEFLHRWIISVPDGFQIDHINRNKLDNRKCNLRVVTSSQNNMNKRKSLKRLSITPFKGLSRDLITGRWRSAIYLNRKRYQIGYFRTEIQAAMAYDIWAKDLFGEYACLNF